MQNSVHNHSTQQARQSQITSLEDSLDLLEGVKKSSNGYMALCPAHYDVNPSLSITVKDNRIRLKCHAGCKTGDILTVMRLTMKDLFLDKFQSHRRVTAIYPYHNAKGKLIFEVVKFDPKGFVQRRPVAGGYEWNLRGVKRMLYRLPEVLQALANGCYIYIGRNQGRGAPPGRAMSDAIYLYTNPCILRKPRGVQDSVYIRPACETSIYGRPDYTLPPSSGGS